MTSIDNRPLPFIYQFTAGAIAGVSELLVMYPLDVVKTRMQLQVTTKGHPAVVAAKAAVDHYTGVMDCLTKIVKKEGFSHLYKGITSPILMEAPKRAIKFSGNDTFQTFYKKIFPTPNGEMTQKNAIYSGASAGAVEAFVVAPFELVKIRLQDVNSQFKTPIEVVKNSVVKGGVLSLFNGLEATIWRHVLWNAGYFGIIFQIRKLLPAAKTSTEKTRNDLIAGAIGGTVGCLLNTPFDVVKSRIQRSSGPLRKYNWSLPSVLLVYREEGFKALYKGFAPKVMRLAPGGGLLLVVFTNVMDFFREVKYGKKQ
ncbi:BCN_G0053820.mRNA.1.CDS.1 [Saccharomyces cerevisiae]|nr:BCN_G0053820.mRNA.1.CDS.1 [Saccharomyces cerevisiae]CAI7368498.1 BCN_G0053820.mRNA.1.CDS.1 [Saccharomyces cerevisiae]